MLKSSPMLRRIVVCLLWMLGLLLAPLAVAQRAMPDAAPLNNWNPLCDSSLVHCLEIDDFAGHVYGHLQVLPPSEHRDAAAVFPFGATLGLFGRLAGGVGSSYAFWREGDATLQQLGPLRLNLTARLLPLFPLVSSGRQAEGDASADASRRFQLGLAYEHEVRVGPFSGQNALGLLTNLASLHLVGSKWLGPFQLSGSLGVLFDWQGRFAAGSVAGQLGWLLPGFRQLKVFVQALGRGIPAQVKTEALPLLPDGQAPIHPQGLIGGGLAFRAHRRVDLGVEVQRGLGSGIAPWVVGVHFLVLSAGKEHEGRAVTPIAQLAADVVSEAAQAIQEYIAHLPIDPKLDENCFILDKDNVTILGRFGKPTQNGYYCEEDGFRVPIHHELERDPAGTKLCRDADLQDCLLERRGKQWVPIHHPKLDSNCDMFDTDDTYLGRLGTPTADGQHCRYAVQKDNGAYGKYIEYKEKPIGIPFHTDADRSRVCTDEEMNDCFLLPAKGRGTLALEGSERFAKHADRRFSQNAQDVLDTAQSVENVATGKTALTTVGAEMKRTASSIARAVGRVVQNPEMILEAAANTKNRLLKAVQDFEKASPERKLDTLGDLTGDAFAEGLKAGATAGVGHLVGGAMGAVRTVANAEEALADAAKAGKKARKAAARAAREGQVIPEHALPPQAARSLDTGRMLNPTKAGSQVWREAQPFKGELRRNGDEIWAWDKLHNDIEVYDRRGRHLGSRNPTTGELYKPPVPGRRIDL